MDETNNKLSIEEYKALGNAFKSVNKNLKLIEKLLSRAEIDFVADVSDITGIFHLITCVSCNLDNLSRKIEDEMDDTYPLNILETNEFFN